MQPLQHRDAKKKSRSFLKNLLTNRGKSDIIIRLAGVAQLVEQLIRNQQVAGPSPATSSKIPNVKTFGIFCNFDFQRGDFCGADTEIWLRYADRSTVRR